MSATRADIDPVATIVREADFARYAAALFAPAEARPHLLALYAFDAELARVRDIVSEPLPGELRLQWWRDALENPERADVVSHPVARALHAAAEYGRLPTEALLGLIDARLDDLYDDPVPTLTDLEARLGATASAVIRLASLIAAGGRDPGGADVAGYGGVADGIVRMLRLLPRHVARGQILLPTDLMAKHAVTREQLISGTEARVREVVFELVAHARRRLSQARAALVTLDRAAEAAVLPLAMVTPVLDRFEYAAVPLAIAPNFSRWRLLLRLWRANRRESPF
ncbi:squalene/phytoene synthase family protein [Chelatococcus sambhunathii]|uniref:Squalene/phytoene synthase family protein n=1 Tax=Chelatococcus sambhunathii TaxID=363953 RepID=A0ABU1DEB1_9HYPH|nr:squalene/phytoene synthase family protein [Chelatococcus sambhunathii]MDR4306461.1 squalene/phytoene synthase family protein [Chelatococcus sambhunathii]